MTYPLTFQIPIPILSCKRWPSFIFFFNQHLSVQTILTAIIVLYPQHMDLHMLHAARDAPTTARSEVVLE